MQTSSSTTHKGFDEPKIISSWIDYFTEVNNFDFEKEAKYNKPAFVDMAYVVRETDVQNALQTNVLFNLNVVLENDGIVFRSASGSDMEGSGISDFVAKRGTTTILVIEVKKPSVLPIVDSSMEFFQNNSKGKYVISQTFSYMVENNLLYGIITTYNHNWFLQREGDNHDQILISETLSFDNNNPTVLKSYAYLALWAKQGHYLPNPNLISIPNAMPQSRYLTRSVNRGQTQQPLGKSQSYSLMTQQSSSGQFRKFQQSDFSNKTYLGY